MTNRAVLADIRHEHIQVDFGPAQPFAEGLAPNGMYDPIDGGPTLVSELAATVSGRHRVHGRARIGATGPVDALVSVAGIDRFRVVRTGVELDRQTITIDPPAAAGLGVETDSLLTAVPLAPRGAA